MAHQLSPVGSQERHPHQIYWAIVNWISANGARPGDRLPHEAELADQFRVSRPTMREAIRVLEYSGLVEVRRGRTGGLFVGAGGVPQVVGALRAFLLFDRSSLRDLFHSREVLEVELARLAATRATAADHAAMRTAIRQMESSAAAEAVVSANTAFHLVIADAAGNTILRAMMQAMTQLLNELVRHAPDDHATIALKLQGHLAIYDAIVAGDADAASEAMRDHIRAFQRVHCDGVDPGSLVVSGGRRLEATGHQRAAS
ncbi:MAG: FCD domain-containing protein [Chloroflexota bacterium]|nr:FCD domain-containing protein [Chloroflexota bacterium]